MVYQPWEQILEENSTTLSLYLVDSREGRRLCGVNTDSIRLAGDRGIVKLWCFHRQPAS